MASKPSASKPASTKPRTNAAKKPTRKQSVKQRVEQVRREQARKERRDKLVIFGATGAVAAALIVAVAWTAISQNAASTSPGGLPKVAGGSGTAAPPWPLPADPVNVARKAGLTVQPMEGTAKHFHAHVDVIVDGRPVAVPANLGIHPAGSAMSELHTHDQRGVIHIEAPTANKRYTLGQVFAEWDVRLDTQSVGGLKADGKKTLRAYVNGKQVAGDPAAIELKPRLQIALVYGSPDAKVNVPATFAFQPGE
jgi:hypothetical protein